MPAGAAPPVPLTGRPGAADTAGRRRRRFVPAAIALLGLVLAGAWLAYLAPAHLAGRPGPLDRLEATFTDWRLLATGPGAPPENVVVVAIDDATLRAQNMDLPVPRERMAAIVDAIREAGAAALAVDVLFVREGDAAADRALAEALASLPSAIAAAAVFEGADEADGLPRAARLLWPQDVFTRTARVGMANLASDETGTPRHVPMLILTERGPQPHLVVQGAALALGAPPELAPDAIRFGARVHPLDVNFHMPLRLFGPPGTVPTVSAVDVLDGRAADALAGRLAVLGVTAHAGADTFGTPFDSLTPGVELLAGGIAQLVDGPPFVRTARIRRVDVAAAAGLAAAGVLALALLPISLGLPIALALLAVWMLGNGVLFAAGQWHSLALPLVASAPPFAATALARHLHERRSARRSERAVAALSRFQAPVLAERIADDPSYLAEPCTQDAAVLFIDLVGFTGISEAVGLAGTRALLKGFHSEVSDEAERFGGVVLNYMGDGAIVAFGLPDPIPADGDHALAAAFALVDGVRALSFETDASVRPDSRIGLHFGPVTVSRLGHDSHQQVTITGDTVNLASRLIEVAKQHGAALAVSDALLARLSAPPAVPPDAMRLVPIRGRAAEVNVALWTFGAEHAQAGAGGGT